MEPECIPMAISIKDPEADQLVRELARRTGETQVTAVKVAVSERLQRLERANRPSRAERLRAIARDTGPRLAGIPPSTDIGRVLYDERGPPA
jgi:antitoxin VapB